MPSKSKQQQKFMGIVRAIQKGEAPAGKFSKAAQKAAKSMKKSSVRKYAKTKHDDLPKKVKEEKKRDYKAEYKKFQSSTKMKKYRAELNKYNRKKGTYGNGDGKDASHKGGKIVGFESQSKNRGRAEKSRLKKESQVNEMVPPMSVSNPAAYKAMLNRQISKNAKVKTALTNKNHKDHKKARSIVKRFIDKFRKKESVHESVYKFKGMSRTDMDEFDAQLSRDNVKGTPDFNKMTYTIHNPKKSVYLDYYIKTKYKKFKPKRIREGVRESINEANNIDKIKDIVNKKQFKRIGGVIIDMQTANAILKVHKALTGANKKKYEKLSISKMASIAYKLIK